LAWPDPADLKEHIIKGFVLDDELLKQGNQYIYAPSNAPDGKNVLGIF